MVTHVDVVAVHLSHHNPPLPVLVCDGFIPEH